MTHPRDPAPNLESFLRSRGPRAKYGKGALLVCCVLLATAPGCGGGGSANQGPQDASDDTLSPGEKCIRDATIERLVPADAPERVGVSHILVRHASLSDPKGATKTREEACLTALAALEALKTGSSWEHAVEEYSDSGHATAGDLGRVRKDELDPKFANAAFSLQVDELSYVVESERGYHIILRTE